MMTYNGNGKLLLTSEYLVLEGAEALALPTRKGQKFHVFPIASSQISWKSYDVSGRIWLNEIFSIDEIINFDTHNIAEHQPKKRLLQVLHQAHILNPNFLSNNKGFIVETSLEFPKNWGLGTSSTFISFVAQWFDINPFTLLNKTFGGSGYDIACATKNHPLVYSLQQGKPQIKSVHFAPPFHENLYFVYLNKKQNSRQAIADFHQKKEKITIEDIHFFSELTNKIITTETLSDFNYYINLHEQKLGKILEIEPVKNRLFHDFEGAIKSLGAWGGDFILVTSTTSPISYFQEKGFDTIIPYKEMVF